MKHITIKDWHAKNTRWSSILQEENHSKFKIEDPNCTKKTSIEVASKHTKRCSIVYVTKKLDIKAVRQIPSHSLIQNG